MALKWTQSGDRWFAIEGKFRAEVKRPFEGGFMYHWSVRAGDISGGSGGTSSAPASKRAAENELIRFKEFLRKRTRTVLTFPGDPDLELKA
jgi:hypothetical protein